MSPSRSIPIYDMNRIRVPPSTILSRLHHSQVGLVFSNLPSVAMAQLSREDDDLDRRRRG